MSAVARTTLILLADPASPAPSILLLKSLVMAPCRNNPPAKGSSTGKGSPCACASAEVRSQCADGKGEQKKRNACVLQIGELRHRWNRQLVYSPEYMLRKRNAEIKPGTEKVLQSLKSGRQS